MTQARTWLGIYAAGFAVLTGFLCVTLFTQAPFGDMTRVARVSEEAFGWHLAPPLIADKDVRNAPLDQADVLVIGDSFSMFFAWQASLVKAGYRVTTTHWDKIGPLCDDLAPWLRKAGFKGRLVVIESIERLLPERIEKARGCRAMQRSRFVAVPPPPQSPAQPAPGFAINWSGQLFSGLITYLNTRAIRDTAGELVVSSENYGDMVFSSPVPDGCRQFSHRLCDKGLFLITDRTNAELTAADADFMHYVTRQAAPLAVSWMVIPNKTTVYLAPEHARAFAQRAGQLGIGPDLFGLAQEVRRQMTDLYWPNDGHWSMHGQVFFGDRMAALTRTLIGAPASDAR